jgi:serine/threonine protein kinase
MDVLVHLDSSRDLFYMYSSREYDFHYLMKPGVSWRTKLRGIYELLLSVHHLHSQSLIHRNITPNNVLVGANGDNIKLCGFEKSRGVQSFMCPRTAAELTPYMAPALLYQSTHYNGKCDVWSVGCVVAEVFREGLPLFQSKDELALLAEIADVVGYPSARELERMHADDANSIEELIMIHPRKVWVEWHKKFSEDTPFEALDFVERCLKYNPKKRATIDDLLNHPLFDSVRDRKVEVSEQRIVPIMHMNQLASVKYYKEMILDEGVCIRSYRRVISKNKHVGVRKSLLPLPMYARGTNASKARLDQTIVPKQSRAVPWVPTAKPIISSALRKPLTQLKHTPQQTAALRTSNRLKK